MPRESDSKRPIWVAIIGAAATIIAAVLGYIAVTGRSESKFNYTGLVHNVEGQPIARAKVSVAEDENIPQLFRTDSEGVFYAKLSKKTQTIRISVEADGYETYTLEGLPARNGPEDIVLKRAPDKPQTDPQSSLPAPPPAPHSEANPSSDQQGPERSERTPPNADNGANAEAASPSPNEIQPSAAENKPVEQTPTLTDQIKELQTFPDADTNSPYIGVNVTYSYAGERSGDVRIVVCPKQGSADLSCGLSQRPLLRTAGSVAIVPVRIISAGYLGGEPILDLRKPIDFEACFLMYSAQPRSRFGCRTFTYTP